MSASYPTYKSTSIPWMPEMPEHWEQRKNKYLFRRSKSLVGKDFEKYPVLSLTMNGVIRRDLDNPMGKMPTTFADYQLIQDNTLLFCLFDYDVTPRTVGMVNEKGIVSPAYTSMYPVEKINLQYYYYWFLMLDERKMLLTHVTNLRNSISYETFAGLFSPFPPLTEQTAIANYLDAKTEQINRFIEKKQKLIALLKEQKQAVINELLEDKEGKWERRKLKFVSKVLRGKFTHRPRNDERLYGGRFPFIQTNSITSTEKYITEYNQTLNDWGYSVSKEFPANTVVMSIAANIADIAILNFNGCFPDSIIGFVPKSTLDTEFLFYSLKSMKEYFYSIATINTQLNLNIDKVANSFITLPELSEQKRIVRDIEIEFGRIDTVIFQIQKEIEKVKELKQSLIAEVVTGKIKVV